MGELNEIIALGPTAFITFGLVWFIGLYFPEMPSKTKFILSAVIAIAVGFIPENIGVFVVDRIVDGLGVAATLAGLYQFTTRAIAKGTGHTV